MKQQRGHFTLKNFKKLNPIGTESTKLRSSLQKGKEETTASDLAWLAPEILTVGQQQLDRKAEKMEGRWGFLHHAAQQCQSQNVSAKHQLELYRTTGEAFVSLWEVGGGAEGNTVPLQLE